MIRRLLVLGSLLGFLTGTAYAQPVDYGETEFENSGAAEAQAPFLRGVLMLHSFEYEDAREAFQEARRIDPDFALAAWGEAMTHNHPIWQTQDREAAHTALDALAPTPQGRLAKATTEREKDYLRTLDALYGAGDDSESSEVKRARDYAYAEALGGLSAKYPDDLDAAAFYALSILGTAHDGRDFSIYMQAAAIAEEVFDANPLHPGAAHYLIHAYDDPVHAPLGLRPAHVYAEIAPAASHALHMPSHIYFALGMWDEGAAMNVRSFEAAKARTDARGEPLGGHGWHPLGWRLYAELQRGRYDEARRLVELAESLVQGDADREGYVGAWWATYVLETERWDDPMVPRDAEALGGWLGDARHYLAATWAALERDDRDAAQEIAEALFARVKDEDDPGPIAPIVALEIEGLLALHDGDEDMALALLSEAAAAEDDLPLDFGPARPTKPAHELLGDVLLRLGQPQAAPEHYEETLARYPRRSRALLGLARAASETDDETAARAAYTDLARSWREADPDLPVAPEVNERAKMSLN